MGRRQNKGKLSDERMSGESKGSRIREDCRERQKGLMEKSSLRWAGGQRIVCFSLSALLFDTIKSDSYHNRRMNHSNNLICKWNSVSGSNGFKSVVPAITGQECYFSHSSHY